MDSHEDRLKAWYAKARRGKSLVVKAMVEHAGAEVKQLPEGIRGQTVDLVIIDDEIIQEHEDDTPNN